jgi:hypothetical protein
MGEMLNTLMRDASAMDKKVLDGTPAGRQVTECAAVRANDNFATMLLSKHQQSSVKRNVAFCVLDVYAPNIRARVRAFLMQLFRPEGQWLCRPFHLPVRNGALHSIAIRMQEYRCEPNEGTTLGARRCDRSLIYETKVC